MSIVLFLLFFFVSQCFAQCYSFHSCQECTANPYCGWCDAEAKCVDGTGDGPTNPMVQCRGWNFGACNNTPLKNGVQYSAKNVVKGTSNFYVFEVDPTQSLGIYVDGFTKTFASQKVEHPDRNMNQWTGAYATIIPAQELTSGPVYVAVFAEVSMPYKITVFQPALSGGGNGGNGGGANATNVPIFVSGDVTVKADFFYNSALDCKKSAFLSTNCSREKLDCEEGHHVSFSLGSSCALNLTSFLFLDGSLQEPAGFMLGARCSSSHRGLCNCSRRSRLWSVARLWFKSQEACKSAYLDLESDCRVSASLCEPDPDMHGMFRLSLLSQQDEDCCSIPLPWLLANAPQNIYVHDVFVKDDEQINLF